MNYIIILIIISLILAGVGVIIWYSLKPRKPSSPNIKPSNGDKKNWSPKVNNEIKNKLLTMIKNVDDSDITNECLESLLAGFKKDFSSKDILKKLNNFKNAEDFGIFLALYYIKNKDKCLKKTPIIPGPSPKPSPKPSPVPDKWTPELVHNLMLDVIISLEVSSSDDPKIIDPPIKQILNIITSKYTPSQWEDFTNGNPYEKVSDIFYDNKMGGDKGKWTLVYKIMVYNMLYDEFQGDMTSGDIHFPQCLHNAVNILQGMYSPNDFRSLNNSFRDSEAKIGEIVLTQSGCRGH